ncbi:hypothetical protein DIP35_00060 [Neisseria gonorrhoeae]
MIINKFIWAMAVFSAILALVIGSGFTALEYVKEPPAAPYAVSAPKTAGVKPRRILPERNPPCCRLTVQTPRPFQTPAMRTDRIRLTERQQIPFPSSGSTALCSAAIIRSITRPIPIS